MLTAAWLFARHGQGRRARTLLACLLEDEPENGTAAAVLADLMLADGEAEGALEVLRRAVVPEKLARAVALLETRALKALGRDDEAAARWRRYVKAAQGGAREWM